jgi:hypothetical protein
MRLLIIILFLISCQQKEEFNKNSTHLTIDLELEQYKRPSPQEKQAKKERWKKRVNAYKNKLKEDIKSRGLSHNIDSLNFEVLKYLDQGARCDKEKKTILLGLDFKESSFIHEIGHCLDSLNYSHFFSYNQNNKEYIMSYSFDQNLLKNNRKKVLDLFFNKSIHDKLNTKKGDMSHKRMILERDFNIRTKNLSNNELTKLYNFKNRID